MNEGIEIKTLKRMAISRVFVLFFILGLVFFLSAGTLAYWQAWAYMFVIAVPMTFFIAYMFNHDPKFIERRMRAKEKRERQRLIAKIAVLPFLLTIVVPGFDRRYGWSNVPLPVTIAGIAVVLLDYMMILHVFKTNSYASRIVEVEEKQKVIATGPYAWIRHPMYFWLIFLNGASPLALGSYWALLPALSILPVLVFRILDEEKELAASLQGYGEYVKKVKYRLIPGVW